MTTPIFDEYGASSGAGTTSDHLRGKDLSVPQTDYFEIGLNLAAKLPEHTSAAAEPKVDRILKGMAEKIWHNHYLYEAPEMERSMTEEKIYAMLVDALDVAR